MTIYAARVETTAGPVVLRGIEADRGDEATTKARAEIRERGLFITARPLVLPETRELLAYLARGNDPDVAMVKVFDD